jgi:sugar phosphate isomerase/epimerase
MKAFHERIVLSVTGCFAGWPLRESLQKARQLGFQSVGLMPQGPAKHSLGELPTLHFYAAEEGQRRRLKELVSGFRHISLHQAWDEEWHRWLTCAAYLGAEIVTVHAGRRREKETARQFLARRLPALRAMADRAEQQGLRIGVENEGGPYEDYVDLVRGVGASRCGRNH